MNTYPLGSVIHVEAEFRDHHNTLIDPTDVIMKTKSPNGAQKTYSGSDVIKESVGLYYVAVSTKNKPGFWIYRWEASGNVEVVAEGNFYIQESSA